MARGARALQVLNHFEDAQAAFRDAATAAPRDAAINTAWGEFFLERQCQTCNTEAVKSFQMALERIRATSRRSSAWRARSPTTTRRPPSAPRARSSRSIRRTSTRTCSSPGQAADAGKRDEARQLIQKALSVNPSSLDAHSLLAALAYVEDKTPEFEAEVAKVLAMSPGHAEVYRVAAEYTAHAYRFDEAVALVRRALGIAPRHQQALADLGMYLLRTGDEGGARNALESSFKLNPYDVVTYNLLEMMDTLDTFITTEQREIVLRIDKADAAVLQAADAGACAPRPRHPEQAVPVHAEGADPDRDVPEARSLRRPHGGPAGHDRRARRLLRAGGDARFAAGAARASSSGKRRSGTSWRTSSRCRCRTSACRDG